MSNVVQRGGVFLRSAKLPVEKNLEMFAAIWPSTIFP